MASTLGDIPGARSRGRMHRAVDLRRSDLVDLTPGPVLSTPAARRGLGPRLPFGRGGRPQAATVFAVVVFTVLALLIGAAVWRATRVDLQQDGLVDGAILTAERADALEIRVTFEDERDVAAAKVSLDGRNVRNEVEINGRVMTFRPGTMIEGKHQFKVGVPRVAFGDASWSWEFIVDGTAPTIDIPSQTGLGMDQAVDFTGKVDPEATLTMNGSPVSVGKDGSFSVHFDRPPLGSQWLEAVDRAGNRTRRELLVGVDYPEIRAVHVTAIGWKSDELRNAIISLIDQHLINAVELDLKDEGGLIGYDSQVPLAKAAGAVSRQYDLKSVVDYLHSRGVRVIGRLVAFRDPVLSAYAWKNNQKNQVIQTPDGSAPYADYGGFTNYADPVVRQYNIDIAVEAAKAGVDDILYDYVRRPDGEPATMLVSGLEGRTSTEVVVDFLRQSQEVLRPMGVHQGASLFGIAARSPDNIAQDVPAIARRVEFIAPMLYPSHWVQGMYGVADPSHQPYDIVEEAMKDFVKRTEGTGVAVVPWLQDFSLGVPYGPAEVKAQIDAAYAAGGKGFLLWNAGAVYTPAALTPHPP